MKVLFLSQANVIEDQKSYDRAFRTAYSLNSPVEVENIPYLGYVRNHGWRGLWDEILNRARNFQPDVVFFQYFHGGDGPFGTPRDVIHQLRSFKSSPLIFGSLGDLFSPGLFKRAPSKALVDLAVEADAFFMTSMGSLASYLEKRGAKNIILVPNAFSETLFDYGKEDLPSETDFDVVWLGSVGVSVRHLVFSLKQTLRRKSVVRLLWKHYGNRFGLFGHGWNGHPAYRGPVGFRDQVELFKRARLVVDARPPVDEVYYSSNRVFFVAGSGTPLVQFYAPRFEHILKPNIHTYFVHDPKTICEVCDRVLTTPKDVLRQRRKSVLDLVRSRHTIEKRVDTILSVAEALQRIRKGISTRESEWKNLRLWHFLPDVDLSEERRYAFRTW